MAEITILDDVFLFLPDQSVKSGAIAFDSSRIIAVGDVEMVRGRAGQMAKSISLPGDDGKSTARISAPSIVNSALLLTIGGLLAGQMIYRWKKDIILTTVVTVVIALFGIWFGTALPPPIVFLEPKLRIVSTYGRLLRLSSATLQRFCRSGDLHSPSTMLPPILFSWVSSSGL